MCVTVVACVGVSISSHVEYGHVKEDGQPNLRLKTRRENPIGTEDVYYMNCHVFSVK